MINSKKIISFLLLFIVVTPMLFYAGYLLKQKVAQVEMTEALENKMLQTIEISKVDLVWEKKGKEAIINGKLFDVKTIKISFGKVILTGLFDDVENNLNKDFAKLFQQKNKANNPLDNLVLKFIFSSAIVPGNSIIHNTVVYKRILFFYFNDVAASFSLPVTSPPPNV